MHAVTLAEQLFTMAFEAGRDRLRDILVGDADAHTGELTETIGIQVTKGLAGREILNGG